MEIMVFIAAAIVLIIVTIYFTLEHKLRCPNCKSSDLVKTGDKIYKEEPSLAAYGSQDSYHSFEYKCLKCGDIFWKERKAIIFN